MGPQKKGEHLAVRFQKGTPWPVQISREKKRKGGKKRKERIAQLRRSETSAL